MRIKVILDRCVGCRSCEMACASSHSTEATKGRTRVQPRIRVQHGQVRRGGVGGSRPYVVTCRHCAKPRCLDACISGAIYIDPSGKVLYDPDRCVGCWMCIMVCPFGAIHRDVKAKRIIKCDLCAHRSAPACVSACKVGALELDPGRKD
jgi:carbon-monoxide dehydrogenase iron sulfur subunit